MAAKKERTVRFMCDLISDQETLLTEADYNIPSVVNEEIASLQPISREEARAQMLNEWNIVIDTTSDSEDIGSEDYKDDDDGDKISSFEENTSEHCNAHKDSTVQTICWGNASDDDICFNQSDESYTYKGQISDKQSSDCVSCSGGIGEEKLTANENGSSDFGEADEEVEV